MTGRGIAFTAFFCHAVGGRGFHGQSGNRIDSAQYGAAAGIRHRVRRMDGAVRSLSGTDAVLRPDPGRSGVLYHRNQRLPAFSVVLYLQAGTGDDVFPRCAFQLSIGGNPQSFCVPIECPHRGIWQMQLRRLKVRDLFGFFSLPLLDFFSAPGRTPYSGGIPASARIGINPHPPSQGHGLFGRSPDSRRYGRFLRGVRAYRQGDSLKQIHWKITAKMRELYSKQYEIPAEPYALVLLDHVWTGRQGEILWTAVIYCASAQAKSCFIML